MSVGMIVGSVLILLFLSIIICIIVGYNLRKKDNVLPPCSQNISNLIKIPSKVPPNSEIDCPSRGTRGIFYYVKSLNSNYDYVVAKWPTQSKDVCIDFCDSFNQGICNGPNYNGKTAQENYNSCMLQLSSTTCTPPIPIAIQDGILFYPYSPTCSICDNCNTNSKSKIISI